MEIILTQNVQNLGIEGETVQVADGYARNYLFPEKMAVRATAANKERFERRRERLEKERRQREEEARDLADSLEGEAVTITEAASDEGSLYGSVGPEDVLDALTEIGYEELTVRQIVIDEPIRETGEHAVRVSLAGSISAEVTVEVVSD